MNQQAQTRPTISIALLPLLLLAFLVVGAALPRISQAAKSELAGSLHTGDAQPQQIQLESSNYSVMQNGLSVTVTVLRVGDSTTEATVDYSTYDDTADQRCDYIMTAGTLTFAAGETSKSFAVLIIDDAYPEASHSFWVKLSNPVGATMGGIGTAAVSIIQQTPPDPTTNPLDGAQFFVREHYFDFLHRLPDDGGLNYWVSQLESCGNDQNCLNQRRIDVSNAFFFEGEFQETASYLYRVYKSGFGIKPSYQQFMESRGQVVGESQLEQSKIDFANAFVERADFLQQYPQAMTSEEFVGALNANTASSLTMLEQQALVDGLNSGAEKRGTVLQKIADNQVFAEKEYNTTFVLTQYFGYMRRDLDQAGFDFWLGQIDGAPSHDLQTQHAIVCSFVTSTEYQQRFSPAVSHNNSECLQ